MLTIILVSIIIAMIINWVRQQIRMRALLLYMHRRYMILPTAPELGVCSEQIVKYLIRRFIRNIC